MKKLFSIVLSVAVVLSVSFSFFSGTAFAVANAATYVSETYADNTKVSGGTSFTKSWTIRNNGTSTWDSGYKLRWVSGDLSTSHSDVHISGTVAPGGTYTFNVPMKAPAAKSSEATYREDWKFTTPSGIIINVSGSSTIWALIKVPASSSSTKTDAATYVSETIPDNTKVNGGASFTKTWTIRNSGTSTWNSSYKLRWVSGSLSTSHSDIPISGSVAPGGTYTFSVPMKAPASQSSESSYRDDWKFTNPSGTTINISGSSTIWAIVKVSASASSDDYGNSISTAYTVSLSNGSGSRNGVLTAGDVDFFRINVTSSGTLNIYTTGSTDTFGNLYSANGSALTYNDDYNSYNFRINWPVSSGTYYVSVRHYNASSGQGAYTLCVQVTGSGNVFTRYPLSSNLTIAENQVTIPNYFGTQTVNGTHLGVDIMVPAGRTVYPYKDSKAYVKFNNTNRTDYPNEYTKYWNSFLIVYYPSLNLYVYYGHVRSSLANNSTIDPNKPLGTIRESYNSSNSRTPSNDHLHLGLRTIYQSSGWGYASTGTSVSYLNQIGWRDPIPFMRGN